jgi:DNA-binding response OmpR family regulator
MRVLVVEDSRRLRDAVACGLRGCGYAVDEAADGREGLIHARTSDYDVIVLDVMLPEMDGLTVLREIRSHELPASVLLLTAKDAVEDRVHGLRSGADDYLVKPFAFDELVARVQALARRRHDRPDPQVKVDDLTVDLGTRQVTRGSEKIDLTPREYALIEYLAHHVGKPVSRIELEDHLYEGEKQVLSNAIDSAICTLRQKLDVGTKRKLIHTRRGMGYVLGAPEE